MAHWLVLGGTGMLGQELVALLKTRGEKVTGFGSKDADITDIDSVRRAIAATNADVVVNCAAHTAVDDAESDEAAAFALNATGPRNAAVAAREAGATFVHVSTDYVFDGSATEPYAVDTLQNPRSAYGRTKAAGEWAVRLANPDAYIVRTAWLYGDGGNNFVRTMLTLSQSKPTLAVVNDQVGQPTWTGDLAAFIVELVQTDCPAGYYHGTSAGQGSWCDLAQESYKLAGLDPERITATTSEAFQRPAPRPAYSVLAPAAQGPKIGDWRERLAASGVVENVVSAF